MIGCFFQVGLGVFEVGFYCASRKKKLSGAMLRSREIAVTPKGKENETF
jgi:hypothetical protein